MFTLSIEVNQTDLKRIMVALNKVRQILKLEENDLPYRQAVGFKDKLFEDIVTGNIENFPAYTQKYREYKDRIITKYGGVDGPYRLHDKLLNSLSVFKAADRSKGWCGGIPNNAGTATRISYWFDPSFDKEVPITTYASYLESGFRTRTGVRPPRPLFVPKTTEYRNAGFIEEADETMKKLNNAWR